MTTNYTYAIPGEEGTFAASTDGGNTYTIVGSINTTRSITGTVNLNTAEQVDLNNPLAPAIEVRTPKSISYKVDGAGMLDGNSFVAAANWNANATALPCRFVFTVNNTRDNASNANVNSVTWSGNFFLSQFQMSGAKGEFFSASLTFEPTGKVTISTT